VVYDCGTRRNLSSSLAQYISVFQAEVYAIKVRDVENLDGNYRNRNICILSDSRAAIKALSNHGIISRLVLDCHQPLMLLVEHKRVQLIWVSDLEGIYGNEMTDQ
jgi:hypothetical protein